MSLDVPGWVVMMCLTSTQVPSASPPDEWVTPAAENARKNPFPPSAEAVKKGRSLFLRHCAVCHGDQGRGDGPAARPHARYAKPPRNLTQPDVQARLTDGEIFWKMSTGRRTEERIIMPSFGEEIPPEDRWRVVQFVRSLVQAEAGR